MATLVRLERNHLFSLFFFLPLQQHQRIDAQHQSKTNPNPPHLSPIPPPQTSRHVRSLSKEIIKRKIRRRKRRKRQEKKISSIDFPFSRKPQPILPRSPLVSQPPKFNPTPTTSSCVITSFNLNSNNNKNKNVFFLFFVLLLLRSFSF